MLSKSFPEGSRDVHSQLPTKAFIEKYGRFKVVAIDTQTDEIVAGAASVKKMQSFLPFDEINRVCIRETREVLSGTSAN